MSRIPFSHTSPRGASHSLSCERNQSGGIIMYRPSDCILHSMHLVDNAITVGFSAILLVTDEASSSILQSLVVHIPEEKLYLGSVLLLLLH